MRQLIVPPLMVNLIMFIVGTVYGIDPNLISNGIVLSTPGGYVVQIQIAAIVFGSISAVIGIAAVLGIRVLGTGVADASVSMVVRAVIYTIVWTVLSIMTFGFLWLIPTFGLPLYTILSIMYGMGVVLQLADQDTTPSRIKTEGGDE